MTAKKSTPAKKPTNKPIPIVPTGKQEPVKKTVPNQLSAEETIDALTPKAEINDEAPKTGDDKPSATQHIPPIKQKHEDMGGEDELNFKHFDENRSMKFNIDADNIGTPQHQSDKFREYFEKFRNEKDAKANNLFINTESLEKLGWRDVATDLGLHIKESTVYKKDEMMLALDI